MGINDNINWFTDGEQATAAVLNRPGKELGLAVEDYVQKEIETFGITNSLSRQELKGGEVIFDVSQLQTGITSTGEKFYQHERTIKVNGKTLSIPYTQLKVHNNGEHTFLENMTLQEDIKKGDIMINEDNGYVIEDLKVNDEKENDNIYRDYFGTAAAISGDFMAIGERYGDHFASDGGTVHIYKYDGANWAKHQYLKCSAESNSDLFGHAVAMHGEYLLASAPWNNDETADDGTVYLFKLINGYYKEISAIQNPESLEQSIANQFGAGVAIYNNRIAISSYFDNWDFNGEDTQQHNVGKVYIYDLDLNTDEVTPNSTILSPYNDNVGSNVNFGFSLAYDQERLLVGCPYFDKNQSQEGLVMIYDDNNNLLQELRGYRPQTNDYFGVSVGGYNGKIVVGAYGDNTDDQSQAGSISVFKWNGTSYLFNGIHKSDQSNSPANYGYVCAIGDKRIIVGHPYSKDNEVNTVGYPGQVLILKEQNDYWIAKKDLSTGTEIFYDNAIQTSYFGKQALIFLEMWYENVTTGQVYTGGIVNGDNDATSGVSTGKDYIIKSNYNAAYPDAEQKGVLLKDNNNYGHIGYGFDWDNLTTAEKHAMSRRSLMFTEGDSIYQMQFRFRYDFVGPDTKLNHVTYQGTLDTPHPTTRFTEYKGCYYTSSTWAQEIARVQY